MSSVTNSESNQSHQLLIAIAAARKGAIYLDPLIARKAIGHLKPPTNHNLIGQLSPRELEILKLIAEGSSNPEIADELYLSLSTIKIHDYANGNEQFDIDLFNDPLSDRTPEELVAYADGKPRFEGESCSPVWCYPNTGYILAGMVVEEATRSSLTTVMRDRLFVPLGLNNTFFAPTEEIVGNETRRYLDLFSL